MPKPPWRTARITDVVPLEAHLVGVQKAGYGVNISETESGVCGIGMCVHDGARHPVAAPTIAVPSPRFDHDDIGRYVDSLRTAIAVVETNLSRR
ncbi:IclR family transcriptional regulator domain-containing protein [Nocardia donostiensis]|uniref:IclR-ED domain-containing protein n=1 Tax=Nocardia donostiensis TaxID=1538463 RepID=A0A1W0B133_9NOCA|nr:IclR family transcriptional regulator C-terminal domain-containing protein [Nocardia donostiensis]ONM48495.1 hypothetical protein B0T46_12420 [Nocardia donostiensis]OQS16116.1 hypothetical protein B0T36_04780 [Nocardia donostiensis]OQS18986.1 hypothetical protein B0T44_16610 [Nocardia donostiensis]